MITQQQNIALAIALVAGMAIPSSRATAATCTVTGSVKLWSMDNYYCDSSHLAYCNTWFERDLDSTTTKVPLKYVLLMLRDSTTYQLLRVGATNSSGAYSLSFVPDANAPCPATVDLIEYLVRVHEDDVGFINPRSRFQVSQAANGFVWATIAEDIPLTGTGANKSGTKHITHNRGNLPSVFARAANLYYTANSALTEMLGWHNDIDSHFNSANGIFHVNYDVTGGGGFANYSTRQLTVRGNSFASGSIIRHELGHIIHGILHKNQANNCHSGYRFGNDILEPPNASGTHGYRSCEWGFEAVSEAVASFYAVRSITSTDKNVWICDGADLLLQDQCSLREGDMRVVFDRIFPAAAPAGMPFAAPLIIGVGDTYVTHETQCVQLEVAGHCRACTAGATPLCTPCQDINADGLCEDNIVWGFRNEANLLRYFWDIIDTHAEPGDDTDRSIGTFASAIAGMPCSLAGAGVDGNCNEPRATSNCNPASWIGHDHSVPPVYPAHALGNGTRDSYNARDIHQVVNTGGSGELTRNCLEYAKD